MYRKYLKRWLDFVIVLCVLAVIWPILLLVTLWLHFANKGAGAFFTQERPGRNGKIFKVIKFKTMTDERDADGNLLPDAERLTPVGRFVRSTSIDELPQLINVLKGDMALIGPRPLLVQYLPLYSKEQARRHEVRPGITGWAQCHGRNSISWTEKFKPGRSVFTWLTEGNDRLSVANHKKYVDGAAELGLQSVVVDDGWELWEETEKNTNGRSKWELLKELTDYGKAKNVDIWVWRPSSPRSGNKTDIGLVDADERSSFMKKCAEAGVKGLKIDFFHTENLFTVNLMENILKDAAKAHLMVIFHGVNKPTGDSYTYPNLLAKEAVRGLESVGAENSWAPGPAWPYHNTVLPFTRWLAGPADYTPLNFRKFCPPSVTFTHQLASIYTFTSPMLIFAADMEDMLSCPGRMFIEEVPVVWDETKVLPESRIGKLAALVRRSGDTWYLSVLNGETPYKGKLQTDFLPKGTYRMTIASDEGSNYKKIVISNRKIKSGKTLQLDLLPGGGYLAKIEKI